MSGIPQTVKDVIDVLDSFVVIGTCIGFLYGAWKWSVKNGINVHDRSKEGVQAMEQINKMASNDLPHLYDESKKTNEHLEKQTTILEKMTDSFISMDTNIKILVDRTPRS